MYLYACMCVCTCYRGQRTISLLLRLLSNHWRGWDRRSSASLRPVWATYCLLFQPGLNSEALCRKKHKQIEGDAEMAQSVMCFLCKRKGSTSWKARCDSDHCYPSTGDAGQRDVHRLPSLDKSMLSTQWETFIFRVIKEDAWHWLLATMQSCAFMSMFTAILWTDFEDHYLSVSYIEPLCGLRM